VVKHFTDEQQQEIVRLYNSGASAKRIGPEFGCDEKPIVRILKIRGAYQPGRRPSQVVEHTQELVHRYRNGESMEEIAAAYRTSRETVRRCLVSAGVTVRVSRHRHEVAPEDLAYVRERRADGLSAKYIAMEMGVPTGTITRWLRMAGLPTRTKGKGPDSARWRGGRIIGPSGYPAVWVEPDDPMRCMAFGAGYVSEHRLVMARSLGRALTPGETVHHINGDISDNRLENLQLRKGNHGKGVVVACLDCGSHNVGPVPITG
jgi:hypothetical protein